MSIQEELSAAPVVPLRYLVSFNPRPTSDYGGDAVYLPMEAISEFGPVDTSRRRPFGELRQGYSYVENGDIALAKVTPCFENGKGLVARNLPDGHAFATTEVTVIRPSAKIDADYLGWILQSSHFVKQGESHMTGSGGLRRVPESFIGSYSIPLPDRRTQRAIADYLDRETARIDTLIEEQQRLIEMLRARKRAVLDEVTAAVDGEVVRLKRLFEPSSDANHPDEQVLSVYRDYGVIPKASRDDNFNRTPENVARYLLVRPGDIVINRMKAWQGSLGVSEHRGIVSGDYEVLRPRTDRLLPQFAHLFLRSPRMVAEYAIRSTGIRPSQWRLYWDQMGMIEMPVPPLSRQREVVNRIDGQTTKIDTLTTETERFIELARERRSALITAAVTGQLDVREMV